LGWQWHADAVVLILIGEHGGVPMLAQVAITASRETARQLRTKCFSHRRIKKAAYQSRLFNRNWLMIVFPATVTLLGVGWQSAQLMPGMDTSCPLQSAMNLS
jgi:hypothetical protein